MKWLNPRSQGEPRTYSIVTNIVNALNSLRNIDFLSRPEQVPKIYFYSFFTINIFELFVNI